MRALKSILRAVPRYAPLVAAAYFSFNALPFLAQSFPLLAEKVRWYVRLYGVTDLLSNESFRHVVYEHLVVLALALGSVRKTVALSKAAWAAIVRRFYSGGGSPS